MSCGPLLPDAYPLSPSITPECGLRLSDLKIDYGSTDNADFASDERGTDRLQYLGGEKKADGLLLDFVVFRKSGHRIIDFSIGNGIRTQALPSRRGSLCALQSVDRQGVGEAGKYEFIGEACGRASSF